VLSLIGDKMTVVVHDATTGSSLDKNRHNEIPVPADTFDDAAVLAVGQEIQNIAPQSATALFSSNDAELYRLQERLFEPQDQPKALRESLKKLLQGKRATHLILITKYRGDTHLRLDDGYIGNGKLSGIGFYRPVSAHAQYRDRQRALASLRPSPISASLVDTETMSVIRETTTRESGMASTAVRRGGLNSSAKVQALEQVIRQAVAGAMPNVLTAK
jgi:hypothetical protein